MISQPLILGGGCERDSGDITCPKAPRMAVEVKEGGRDEGRDGEGDNDDVKSAGLNSFKGEQSKSTELNEKVDLLLLLLFEITVTVL